MTLIKICGITRPADAETAANLGADFIGFNFYPASPRCLSIDDARTLMHSLPTTVESVALVVNEPWYRVADLTTALSANPIIQIHADSHQICDSAATRWIPAFGVRDVNSLTMIRRFLSRCKDENRLPFAILLDAHVAGKYGGTGESPPWHFIADFQVEVPLILAGGLNADNVVQAIRIVKPWAVDVASGVESSPGVKDPEKMKRFIAAVRSEE